MVCRAHPRMRGEDVRNTSGHSAGLRLTPACAGKTSIMSLGRTASAAHPRMRGEDPERCVGQLMCSGSHPHARGRRRYVIVERNNLGLTPACAGKTDCPATISRRQGAHPRMRGEDLIRKRKLPPVKGSPPHARGRRPGGLFEVGCGRLTPACAGKTVRFPRESDKVVLQFTNFS